MQNLKKEMQAAARGEIKSTADVAQPSFESVEATVRLLAPESHHLIASMEKGNHESLDGLAGALHKKGRKPVPVELLSR